MCRRPRGISQGGSWGALGSSSFFFPTACPVVQPLVLYAGVATSRHLAGLPSFSPSTSTLHLRMCQSLCTQAPFHRLQRFLQTKPSVPYLLAFLSCFSAAGLSVFLWLKSSILLVPPTKTRSLSLLEQPVCCTKTFREVSPPSWSTLSPLLCSPSIIRHRAKDFTGMISSSESSYEVRTIMTPPLHTGQPRIKEMR